MLGFNPNHSHMRSMSNFSFPAVPRWKRVIDILFCLPALPVLALMTLFMALVITCCAPGPVFFRQERVGLGRRRFMCFKFRTMHVRAETDVHREHFAKLIDTNAPMVKIDTRDSRLIPGGRVLRATGLDELPQLINVLRGDMSLVGPRPCIPYEYEKYQPWQRERFDTLPGITGLWQVSGKNRTTFEQMMHLDIRYARTKTLLMDLRIIALTPVAIATQIYDTLLKRAFAPPVQLQSVSQPAAELSQSELASQRSA
jgi:lipopolysaccharide/colanic/teichoic acid biosynthesis glycosyltransferase